jgi:hypothetical protein
LVRGKEKVDLSAVGTGRQKEIIGREKFHQKK